MSLPIFKTMGNNI